MEDRPAQSFAPMLPNPDEPPVTVEDEVSLSPKHPMTAPAPVDAGHAEPARYSPLRDIEESDADDTRHRPTLDAGWRAPPPPPPPRQAAPPQARQHSAYFDAMWPAESKPAKGPAASEAKPEPDLPPRESTAALPPSAEPEAAAPGSASEPRGVAILKSGVVDGMGYTLYVDGSIEAELPQGMLRFASINELRSHLEKNS
jgi:hypothetical protein